MYKKTEDGYLELKAEKVKIIPLLIEKKYRDIYANLEKEVILNSYKKGNKKCLKKLQKMGFYVNFLKNYKVFMNKLYTFEFF